MLNGVKNIPSLKFLESKLQYKGNTSNCMQMVKMQSLAGIFALVLLLCLAHHCISETDREMVVVLKGDRTPVPYEDKGKITMRKPRAFRVPAFVGGVFNAKEFFVLLCDARYQGFSDWSFIEAAAITSYGDYKNWSNVEIFAKNTRHSPNYSVMGDITAVMKGNKIFVLASSWDVSRDPWAGHATNKYWNALMIVGTVVFANENEGGGASIKWGKQESLKSLLPATVNGASGFQFIGGIGNGVVTKKGTIVFPIQIANSKKQVFSSIMYSIDDGANWIMGGTTPNGPSECSVIEWEEEKLILTTRYDRGVRKIYESEDMGKTWKESLIFSEVWGNQPNRRGVGNQGSAITAPVDGKNVLLFSHPLNKRGGYARDTLQLWMSDGKRIMCVGTISEKGKGESSGYSILAYVGNNLYIMHEINPFGDWKKYNAQLKEWDRVMAFSPLSHFFENVKNTVRAWRELDTMLKNKGVPTDALVGFLENWKTDNAVWADLYNSVNATVNGGTRANGGFCFKEAQDSGAKWPVESQGQNQFYIFTRRQFTLAATVIIHNGGGKKDISIFGASGNSQKSSVVLGLGYTKEKKWLVLHTYNKKMSTEVKFVLEKEHHVAITFNNGAAVVFVDGVDITNGALKLSSTVSVKEFFLGGMGKSSKEIGGSCTVKNVMLFNRGLEQNEIAKLSQVTKDSEFEKQTQTALPKVVTDVRQSVSTKEPKELSAPSTKKVSKGEAKDKRVNKAEHGTNGAVVNEDTKGDKSAVWSLYDLCSICLLCSLTALSVF